jgi:catechol 2,3-dioxygenase-like lactoylglutathione lyase family enzyme
MIPSNEAATTARVIVESVHHTSFRVIDLERAVAFFRDGFGFPATEIQRAGAPLAPGLTGVAGATLRLSFVDALGHQLELIEYLTPSVADGGHARPSEVGAAHLALVVSDIDAAMEFLLERGGRLTGDPQALEDGTRSVYVRTLDGIPLEFIQFPRSSTVSV